MARLASITQLLKGMMGPPHDYKNTTFVFPTVNTDKVAADLQLREMGADRGRRNLPPADARSHDEIELQIIDYVEEQKNIVHQLYEDQVRTYAGRLNNLNFQARFAQIQQIAPATVGQFRAAATQGRDQLVLLRRNIVEAEIHRDKFRADNNITRPAKKHGSGNLLFKKSLLLAVFIIEVALNGAFLAGSSEGGFREGGALAAGFAFINIGVSFGIGLLGIPFLNGRGFGRKLVGFLSLALYLVLAFGLNLTLAHYRDAAALLIEDAGQKTLQTLTSAPFALHDIQSWLLFGVGAAFSFFAMLDGFFYRDPFPGYGAVEHECATAHENYWTKRADLIEELREIKSDASGAMQSVQRDISARRGEFDDIQQARQTLNNKFLAAQAQLQRVATGLIGIYRDSNRSARTTPTPPTFSQPVAIASLPITSDASGTLLQADLQASIKSVFDLLDKQVAAIESEFLDAIASYKQIDDLMPDSANAP